MFVKEYFHTNFKLKMAINSADIKVWQEIRCCFYLFAHNFLNILAML